MLLQENSKLNTITLWTCQSQIVVDTIQENGIYHVKKEYIQEKYQEVSSVFLEAYNWFVLNAQKIVSRPEEAEYPVWLFPDLNYVYCIGDFYMLKIEVSAEKVILFDYEKWNRILNLAYIPIDQEDDIKYKNSLQKQGIYNESDFLIKNYYPAQKAKVKKSWERLFDNSSRLSNIQQAALWEIRKEWVSEIREVSALI